MKKVEYRHIEVGECVDIVSFRSVFIFCAVLATMLCAGASFPHFSAHAQGEVHESEAGYDPVVMPKRMGTVIVIDNDEEQPKEPTLAEVKFLKLPPQNSIKEKADRLIWGIRKGIRPEYDHYGHEIRRYMAGTFNVKIFEDEEYLVEQINNTRKAKIIATYWGAQIEEKITDIENEIDMAAKEGKNVEFASKTAFKQNKLTSRKFIISLRAWIDANERLLMLIYENPNQYSIQYPEINIVTSDVRSDAYNLILVKQTKLKEIRNYKTFEMMVY